MAAAGVGLGGTAAAALCGGAGTLHPGFNGRRVRRVRRELSSCMILLRPHPHTPHHSTTTTAQPLKHCTHLVADTHAAAGRPSLLVVACIATSTHSLRHSLHCQALQPLTAHDDTAARAALNCSAPRRTPTHHNMAAAPQLLDVDKAERKVWLVRVRGGGGEVLQAQPLLALHARLTHQASSAHLRTSRCRPTWPRRGTRPSQQQQNCPLMRSWTPSWGTSRRRR